jgi:UDP-glucose 4-epimerase
MASIISKWIDNYKNNVKTNLLFSDSKNIKRDFIHINDITKVNIMFLDYYKKNKNLGDNIIYDVGIGVANSFLNVANNIIKHTKGNVKYVDNPYNKDNYQFYTKANIEQLSKIYKKTYKKNYKPLSIKKGIKLVFTEKIK